MTREKLTTAEALKLVEQIEALQEQIDGLYAKARDYDGVNNDSVISDAVDRRKEQRRAAESAEALLGSFDAEDDIAA